MLLNPYLKPKSKYQTVSWLVVMPCYYRLNSCHHTPRCGWLWFIELHQLHQRTHCHTRHILECVSEPVHQLPLVWVSPGEVAAERRPDELHQKCATHFLQSLSHHSHVCDSKIAMKTIPSPSPATIHLEWSKNHPDSLSMFQSSSWIASFNATQTSPLSSTLTRSQRSIVKWLYSGQASVSLVTSMWHTFMLGHCTCGRSCNRYAWSCPVLWNSELNSDQATTTAGFTWNWSDRSPVVLAHSISVEQIVCFPIFSTQLHIEYHWSTAYCTLKTVSSCSEHSAVQGSSVSAINSRHSVNKTTGCGSHLSFTMNLHCSYTWPSHHHCRWVLCMSFLKTNARRDTAKWTVSPCTWSTHAAPPWSPHHWLLLPRTRVSCSPVCTTPFHLQLGPTPCPPCAEPWDFDPLLATWLQFGWWVVPWPWWLQPLGLHSNPEHQWRQNLVGKLTALILTIVDSKLAEDLFLWPVVLATAPDAIAQLRITV